MAGPSNYFANLVLNNFFRGDAMTIPATWYLALYTVAPSDAGGGTEVSGGGYARLALTKNTTVFAASTARQTGINSTASYPEATANWGSVVAVAFFDAPASGNMMWWGTLDAAQVINVGDTFRIPAGAAGIRVLL